MPQPNVQMRLAFRPAPPQVPAPRPAPINGPQNPAWLQNNGIQPFGHIVGIPDNQQYGYIQQSSVQPGASTQYPIAVEGRSLEDILATLAQFAPADWAAPANAPIKIEDTQDDVFHPSAQVIGYDGIRIKAENTSGDYQLPNPEMVTAPQYTEHIAPPQPTRPQRPRVNGVDPNTTCHNAEHLVDQLHHHRLKCGHEVFTSKPQPCGINCEVPRAIQPPTQVPFKCPDVGCEEQWKRQERQEQKAFAVKTKPGRLCYSSATEGTSSAAMAQRNAEVFRKQEELAGRRPPQRQQRRRGPDARDRSRSPRCRAKAASKNRCERSPIAAQMLDSNVAELLEQNRHHDPLVKLENAPDMTMAPDYVTAQQRPWNFKDEKSAAGPGMLAYETGNVTEWSMPAIRINDPRRAGIFQAVDDDVQAQQFPDWEIDVQQKHCVCQVSADGYMLPCTDCGFFFHPLCVGKAMQVMTEYGSERDDEARLKDRQYWHDSNKFTCNFCDNHRAAESREMTFKQQEAERKRVKRDFERLEDGVRDDEAEAEDFFGFICGGCYERIIDTRFRCRSCSDDDKGFSFCRSCAENPKMTVIHKHEGKARLKNAVFKVKQTAKVASGDVVMTG